MAAQPSTEPPPPEPLKYQRWVLKVPIHCEGCKRKVKKVLHSIEGVYTIAIEPKQHKVTVTGDVAADTLVKKLIKEGKQAELWPEQENKQGEGKKKKKKKKKKENEPKSSEEDGASESTEKEENEGEEQKSVKISEGGAAVTLKLNGGKPESKQTVKVTEIDMKGSGGDVSAENKASSGSKSSKKKKKTGHKATPPTNEVDVSVGPPPGITGYIPLPGQVNLNPPMQRFYPYPAYEPPSYGPPMYAASYNTSYPTAHHAGLYQMGPPPPYANAYMFTDELYTPSQPLDLIDDAYAEEDEEGSGCSIM